MNFDKYQGRLEKLIKNYSEKDFIFDFLQSYDIPKSTISLLKSGNRNLSKRRDQVILRKKLFFQKVSRENIHKTIETLDHDQNTFKYNPRFIIVTDDKSLEAIDTKTEETLNINISELPENADFFLPLAGKEKYTESYENPADVKAAYKMVKLYDELIKANPKLGENLENDKNLKKFNIFFSRLLFCFFAEDTGLFTKEKGLFTKAVSSLTEEDGSDLDSFLRKLFEMLNTPYKDRTKIKAPVFLRDFDYVNGGLFSNEYYSPKFTKSSRKLLIEIGGLHWKDINPDIFGSMIQAVVNPEQRSSLGMHYTSVPNIKKVIEPLFLNELYDQLKINKDNPLKLKKLLERIYNLKIFDPACGSGNFLIIAYKELRILEINIFKQLQQISKEWAGEKSTIMTGIRLNQFYGIELDNFASEVAVLSLWLAEHQMNVVSSELFGSSIVSLPLRESGQIVCGNATRLDWEKVCPKTKDAEIYILGNPPYLGGKMQSKEQKLDLECVINKTMNQNTKKFKNLDYISCWFLKGAEYIKNSNLQLAFVSTNSICQGEQVELLWPHIFEKNIEISFCFQSFKWKNFGKKNAGVICVIVGLKKISNLKKIIFTEKTSFYVDNINPYLQSGKNIIVGRRPKTLSKNLSKMVFGSMARDGGYLILSEEERASLIDEYPESRIFIRELVGAYEFLKSLKRYCLWIEDKDVEKAMKIPFINRRLKLVKDNRLKSKAQSTRTFAEQPHRFVQISFQKSQSILIPSVTSEKRKYIPMAYLGADSVIVAPNLGVYNAKTYVFGVLSSLMHMVWVRAVAGRLKTDFRYSSELCYNTFPIPPLTPAQTENIKQCVYAILEQREKHSEKTMAQLYDPDKMPAGLREAHHNLDLAVERCYRSKPFSSDEERLEHLFKLYEKMIADEK